jgi:glycosyltransferase involved in cell wall biosynthesis
MRLAIVSQEYPPETAYGGIGTQNHAKAHGLAALGHDVHVIAHSTDDQTHEYEDGPVDVTRIPGVDRDFPLVTEEARWITYSTQVAAAVAALNARCPLDLVEFPDWGSEAFVHLLNQTEENRIPTVIHLHGPIVMFAHAIGWPEPDSDFYRVARMMEETCVRRADAVISSSRCSAEWCQRFYGLDCDNVPVIHTGVDTKEFRPREVPKYERPTIIFVGKIERNKGVALLVEAACRLSNQIPDLQLRIVGSGNKNLKSELKRRAEQTNCPTLLDFGGFVDHHELPQHLSRAHVFAAPSDYEGGPGFVYLEAMACGLPVIACSGSGASEVVIPEENGLLVPPRDLEALTQALLRLFQQPNYREKLGRQAREFAVREVDREVCLRRLESFYLSVANKQARQEAVC